MATLGNNLAVFQMLRIELPYDTAFLPRRNENMPKNTQKTKNPPQTYMFIATLFLTAKTVEKSRYPSTDKRINKVGCPCTWNLL